MLPPVTYGEIQEKFSPETAATIIRQLEFDTSSISAVRGDVDRIRIRNRWIHSLVRVLLFVCIACFSFIIALLFYIVSHLG